MDILKSIGKWIGIILLVIFATVLAEKAHDWMFVRTTKVYIIKGDKQYFHTTNYMCDCTKQYRRKDFIKVTLKDALDAGYTICPECEKLEKLKFDAQDGGHNGGHHRYID